MTRSPEELDRELAALGEHGHRAVVAGVVRGGEHVWRSWSADGRAPGGSALFEIGSITKVFTGILLADMHLRGEVALDDPLSRHLPGRAPTWRYREPTLLELATHRSDLPNVPRPLQRRELAFALGFGDTDPWGYVTEADYQRMVAAESPRRPPGGRVRYSSMAVGLLGDALAARADTAYEQLLADRILRPLGMESTAVTVPAGQAARLATGHSRRGRPRPPIRDRMPAAGSLRSSVEDMLRFLGACLQPPPGPLGAAFALARQPQARVNGAMQVGLCWMILSASAGRRIIWHNGGTWGFRSFAGFAPESGTAAVALSNTARSVDRFGRRLVEAPAPEAGPEAESALS